jgi:hypothetical protein
LPRKPHLLAQICATLRFARLKRFNPPNSPGASRIIHPRLPSVIPPAKVVLDPAKLTVLAPAMTYCLIRWIDYRVPSPRPSPIRWERVPAGRVRAMVYSIPRTPHYFQGRSFPRNMPTIIPQHKAIGVA